MLAYSTTHEQQLILLNTMIIFFICFTCDFRCCERIHLNKRGNEKLKKINSPQQHVAKFALLLYF
jgi:hypothetical protein